MFILTYTAYSYFIGRKKSGKKISKKTFKTLTSISIKIHNKKYSINNTYCIYVSNKTQELSLSLSLLNLLSINIAFFIDTYRYIVLTISSLLLQKWHFRFIAHSCMSTFHLPSNHYLSWKDPGCSATRDFLAFCARFLLAACNAATLFALAATVWVGRIWTLNYCAQPYCAQFFVHRFIVHNFIVHKIIVHNFFSAQIYCAQFF